MCMSTQLRILTSCRESKLSADHLSIRYTPGIIAHCAPGIGVAQLNTTLQSRGTTNQSDPAILATSYTEIQYYNHAERYPLSLHAVVTLAYRHISNQHLQRARSYVCQLHCEGSWPIWSQFQHSPSYREEWCQFPGQRRHC